MQRIFVTGLGIISPVGKNVDENHDALLKGKSGISHLELFSSRYAKTLRFGEIKASNQQLIRELGLKGPGLTRTILLAAMAFREALLDSKLSGRQLSSPDTALINGNTVGGMCLTDELYHDSNKDNEGSEYLNAYDCGSVSLFLQQKYAIKGIVNTINTACSSSANAIMFGARLIRQGLAKRAIVGGVDSLAKFTINGFNALMILADEDCKPFDQNRKGLNLGEGAAFLVLEGEQEAKGKKIHAELTGYANSNDAFHPSALSEEGIGPYLSMKKALETASLSPSEIDYVNAHGTGTENNDEAESKAMIRLFGHVPPFSSTKSSTGHTLGGAGAIEAVFSILTLKYQELYPHLNFTTPIESTRLKPVLSYEKKKIRNVMSNSFGFGGNCSSLIFSKT